MKPLVILAGVCIATGGLGPRDATPSGGDARNRGHIWIVEQDAGQVLEVDRKLGVLWKADGFSRPRDVEVLPNGHIVVAGLDGKAIEVGRTSGRVLRYEGKEGLYAVRWLRNGNLLIAGQTRLVEVDPARAVVWELPIAGKPNDVAILRDGNYLLANYGASNVLEISREKGQIRSWTITKGPMSVQYLGDGKILVAEVGADRASEWDAHGKMTRELRTGCNCPSAYRTRRGTTLISTWTRVYEIDGGGKTVWESPPVKKCVRAREF